MSQLSRSSWYDFRCGLDTTIPTTEYCSTYRPRGRLSVSFTESETSIRNVGASPMSAAARMTTSRAFCEQPRYSRTGIIQHQQLLTYQSARPRKRSQCLRVRQAATFNVAVCRTHCIFRKQLASLKLAACLAPTYGVNRWLFAFYQQLTIPALRLSPFDFDTHQLSNIKRRKEQ
jgi:hypothetical protein